jgi:hypothetical protein
LTGSSGSNGAQGISGIIGAAGATGDQGGVGPTGLTGSTGVAGIVGATGAAGSSSTHYGSISFASVIQGAAGSSQPSYAFGSFLAGKSYKVRIQIDSYNATKNLLTYPLLPAISAQGAAPILWMSYSVHNGSYWISSAKQDQVALLIDLIIDGSNTATDFNLIATITCGSNTTAFAINLSGKYLATEVGQVAEDF